MNSMKDFAKHLTEVNTRNCMEVPSVVKTHEFVDTIINVLFPIKTNCILNPDEISIELDRCSIKLRELLYSIKDSIDGSPQEIAKKFFMKVPSAFDNLMVDAETMIKSDPAAFCIEEIILSYPGFYCISVYRMAHILSELNIPVLPRSMMEYAHSKTGIDIHPGATIGTPFLVDHGTGIVIGETAVIGKNVKLYQGVTLGAISVDKGMAKTKRHPTIEDDVVIYAGSTILGGKTVIGHDTIIGGNTWITESILPHSVVFRQHRVVIMDSKDYKEPIDFVI
jgi:serine O-acetyltransferase